MDISMLTTIAAFVGALTGSVGLFWNIYNAAWRDRARLKIHAQLGGGYSGYPLEVNISNVGRRPISISTTGRSLKTRKGGEELVAGRPFVPSDTQARLNEGEQCTIYFSTVVTRQVVSKDPSLQRWWVEVIDGTGHSWPYKLPESIVSQISVGEEKAHEVILY